MVQLGNSNLQLLLLRCQANGGQHLCVRNKHGSQKLLQIITLSRRAQTRSLALHLIDIPLGNALEQLLESKQHLLGLWLLQLRLIQQIEKILLKRWKHILTQLLRIFSLCLRIYTDSLACELHRIL